MTELDKFLEDLDEFKSLRSGKEESNTPTGKVIECHVVGTNENDELILVGETDETWFVKKSDILAVEDWDDHFPTVPGKPAVLRIAPGAKVSAQYQFVLEELAGSRESALEKYTDDPCIWYHEPKPTTYPNISPIPVLRPMPQDCSPPRTREPANDRRLARAIKRTNR